MAEYHRKKEYRKKLSKIRLERKKRLGYLNSPETREKMRVAKLGKPSPLKGRKWSRIYKKKLGLAISLAQRGEKNHNWKGGITPIKKIIRECYKYRLWRLDVFTRDNWICQLCRKKSNWIEADHYPKMFAEIFHEYNIKSLEEALNCEEFWDINNGRTLCKKCHNKKIVLFKARGAGNWRTFKRYFEKVAEICSSG